MTEPIETSLLRSCDLENCDECTFIRNLKRRYPTSHLCGDARCKCYTRNCDVPSCAYCDAISPQAIEDNDAEIIAATHELLRQG